MTLTTFAFNIAFTQAVNPPDETVILTSNEFWYGIRRGGRNPHDFAEYVASCEVVTGGKTEFRRKLTLANGAVHTAAGEELIQDVVIAENLHVSHQSRSPINAKVPLRPGLQRCLSLNGGRLWISGEKQSLVASQKP